MVFIPNTTTGEQLMSKILITAPFVERLPSVTALQDRTLVFDTLSEALAHAEKSERVAAVLLANASVIRSEIRKALNEDLPIRFGSGATETTE